MAPHIVVLHNADGLLTDDTLRSILVQHEEELVPLRVEAAVLIGELSLLVRGGSHKEKENRKSIDRDCEI